MCTNGLQKMVYLFTRAWPDLPQDLKPIAEIITKYTDTGSFEVKYLRGS